MAAWGYAFFKEQKMISEIRKKRPADLQDGAIKIAADAGKKTGEKIRTEAEARKLYPGAKDQGASKYLNCHDKGTTRFKLFRKIGI